MKRCVLIALINVVISVAASHAWPTVYPTGTTTYDPEKAFNGYIVYTPMDFTPPNPNTTYKDGTSRNTRAVLLIDMRGSIRHVWEMSFDPLFGQLLPNGHLLVLGYDGRSKYTIPGTAGKIVEFDWEGKKVFEYEDLSMHHDFDKLPNGNYIYTAFEPVPKALQAKVRGGIKGSELPGGVMLGEQVVEVDPKGKVVWRWSGNEHLDPNIDIIGPVYKREEWLHANAITVLENGNIALCSRQADSVLIIDKKSKKVIKRFGSPSYLDKQTGRIEYQDSHTKTQYMGGPHDVRQIPRGYPGAGNLTIYDNGLYTTASRAVELDPASGKVVWFSRQPGMGRKQFSTFTGSTQRLPNGNTLLCEGANGRFVQITPENEVVWEYINPYIPAQKFQGAVLKVDLYAPDYCPQLEKLPAAKSAAVTPPENERLNMIRILQNLDSEKPAVASNSTTTPTSTNTETGIGETIGSKAVIAWVVTVLLAFFVGWKLKKS